MTGPDVPDYNDLDPNSLPEDGLPEGSLPGDSSPEEAWDWVDLDRQDETGPIESTEPESDPAVTGGLRSVGFIDGPAARNGKNGHGGPASATRAPARRGNLVSLHVEWCYDHYPRSYRPSDNTWKPKKGSRRECYSPYL